MRDVFDAVADSNRRKILELLLVGGTLSLSELSASLPISRQAVTKHVDILEHAGLVEQERLGRERLHRLTPMPLLEIAEWLAPYAWAWGRRFARLESHLKDDKNNTRTHEKARV